MYQEDNSFHCHDVENNDSDVDDEHYNDTNKTLDEKDVEAVTHHRQNDDEKYNMAKREDQQRPSCSCQLLFTLQPNVSTYIKKSKFHLVLLI